MNKWRKWYTHYIQNIIFMDSNSILFKKITIPINLIIILISQKNYDKNDI
jgi:hypothetical protein